VKIGGMNLNSWTHEKEGEGEVILSQRRKDAKGNAGKGRGGSQYPIFNIQFSSEVNKFELMNS
jgi:hypothetical protein